MQPRVDFITLSVPDLAAARRFYVDGLGWKPTFEAPGEVVFLQVGHGLLLGLFDARAMAADLGGSVPGAVAPPPPATFRAMTLSHNVDTEQEVADVLDRAVAAGGTLVKPAQRADFGGFHGHFADPAGFIWEVANNPGWRVAPDGTVHLGPIGD